MNYSILEMIFADTYLLYKAVLGDHFDQEKMPPRFFYEMLACELIDIKIDDEEGTETRSQKRKHKITEGTYFIHCQQMK